MADNSPGIVYKLDTLGACLGDLRKWLLERTWIQWYYRDNEGSLRPIWHPTEAEEDRSSEERWRGYKSWVAPKDNVDNQMQLSDDQLAVDVYGRKMSSDHPFSTASQRRDRRASEEFREALPEFPYLVVKTGYSAKSLHHLDLGVLQFWTLHTFLYLVPSTVDVAATNEVAGEGLARYDIADSNSDWCGSIVLDVDWVGGRDCGTPDEFIAISEAKEFTQEECEAWTYYIPMERNQSEWCLFYVLLIEKIGPVWERVALGKVFKEGFREATWDEIMLG